MSKYQVKKTHLKLLNGAVKTINERPYAPNKETKVEVVHTETENYACVSIVKGELVITSVIWSDKDKLHSKSSDSLISRVIGNLMFWAVEGRESFQERYN
jgi:hypothetical protein